MDAHDGLTIRYRIGWHFPMQGYFTTVGDEMKKPGRGPPGRKFGEK
jgi:hypothetical protein